MAEKVDHHFAGSQVAERVEGQAAVPQLAELVALQQRVDAHRRLCGPVLPPSCVPSTLCGSP